MPRSRYWSRNRDLGIPRSHIFPDWTCAYWQREMMKRTQSKTEVNINHNSCLIFKTDVTKVLYTPKRKNPSLLANFTNPFIIHEVTICFDLTNTRHVIAGKFSAKPHGRYRCHIWIQYGPYMAVLTFYIYVFNMFQLHPLHVLTSQKDDPPLLLRSTDE